MTINRIASAAVLIAFMLTACSAAKATESDILAARPTLCAIESRSHRFPDTAVSSKGAVGYCQILPDTASWVVKHAIADGLLVHGFIVFYGKPDAWKWLLQVRFVNEAITDAYLLWIYRNRSRDTRTVLYKYHAGHQRRLKRGTESWRHSNEVFWALYPHMRPPRVPIAKV